MTNKSHKYLGAYHLIVLLVFLVTIFLTLIYRLPQATYIYIVASVLFYVHLVYLFLIIAQRKFVGEFIIRKQRHGRRPIAAFIFLIAVLGAMINGKVSYMILTVWGMLLIYDLTVRYYIKRNKPIGIVVDQGKIIFNQLHLSTRNLEELNGLSMNRMQSYLTLTFVHEKKAIIEMREYSKSDMKSLVEICLANSLYPPLVPDNVKNALDLET